MNWAVFGQMALAWVVTVPSAALLAAGVYGVTQLSSHAAAAILLAILGLVLLVALLRGVRRTARSAHFEPDRSPGAGHQAAAGS